MLARPSESTDVAIDGLVYALPSLGISSLKGRSYGLSPEEFEIVERG